MSKSIVIVGNVVDGLSHFGPFNTPEAATQWAEMLKDKVWCLGSLQSPAGTTADEVTGKVPARPAASLIKEAVEMTLANNGETREQAIERIMRENTLDQQSAFPPLCPITEPNHIAMLGWLGSFGADRERFKAVTQYILTEPDLKKRQEADKLASLYGFGEDVRANYPDNYDPIDAILMNN